MTFEAMAGFWERRFWFKVTSLIPLCAPWHSVSTTCGQFVNYNIAEHTKVRYEFV
jgi:hypothetical protein